MALPVGKVFGGVKTAVSAELQSDGSWKVSVATIVGGTASVFTAVTLSAALSGATLLAFGTSGPLGAALIFVPGSVLVADLTQFSFEVSQQATLDILQTQSFKDFQNYLSEHIGVSDYLQPLRTLYNDFINSGFIDAARDRLHDFLNGLDAIADLIPFGADGKTPLPAPGVDDGAGGGAGGGFDEALRQTPIALDLDGDGLEYTALRSSNAFFDIDGDGFAERVEWVGGDDGFLVRDLNGNGRIDNIGEMFGDQGGTTAYQKLAALNSNGDNALTAADTGWASLKVWRDSNRDGNVDAGELRTLAELGITAIGTTPSAATVFEGHAVAGTSTFTINGTTRNAANDNADVRELRAAA